MIVEYFINIFLDIKLNKSNAILKVKLQYCESKSKAKRFAPQYCNYDSINALDIINKICYNYLINPPIKCAGLPVPRIF